MSTASNPGHVQVNFLIWMRYYPKWPLILTTALIASLLVTAAFRGAWALLFLAVLGANYIYWKYVRACFINGCVNPAVVVSVRPLLIAVYTDLTKGRGNYPAIKILPIPLTRIAKRPPEVGMRLATIAFYVQGPNPDLPHWVDFTPFPTECATTDAAVNVRVLESISAEDWALLQAALATVPAPRQAGLYPIDVTALTDVARQYQPDPEVPPAETPPNIDKAEVPLADSAGMTQYCLGFPCVEERALTAAERSAIAVTRQQSYRMFVAMLAGCLALAALIGITNPLLVPLHPHFTLVIPGSLFLLLTLGVLARQYYLQMQACAGDLATGTLRMFRGFLAYDSEMGFSKEKWLLMRKRVLRKDIKKPQTLEIAGSGRIIRANGHPVASLFMPAIVRVATQPAFAAIARQAEWMDQVGKTDDDEPILMNRRELSAAEHDELRMLAKQAVVKPLVSVPIFTAVVAYAMLHGMIDPSSANYNMPLFYVATLAMLLTWIQCILGARKAFRLRRVEQRGVLIILRGPEVKHQYVVPTQTDDVIVEVFPQSSDLLWTINGVPAPWRKSTEPDNQG